MKEIRNYKIGYQILRIGLGVNILIHGLVRLGDNFVTFTQWMVGIFAHSILPESLVVLCAYVIVPLEVIIGVLLILGILILPTLIVGSLLMSALIFGMGLLQKWDIVGLQLNYVFFYALLTAFHHHNKPLWSFSK